MPREQILLLILQMSKTQRSTTSERFRASPRGCPIFSFSCVLVSDRRLLNYSSSHLERQDECAYNGSGCADYRPLINVNKTLNMAGSINHTARSSGSFPVMSRGLSRAVNPLTICTSSCTWTNSMRKKKPGLGQGNRAELPTIRMA